MSTVTEDALRDAMQRWVFLEDPAPEAAMRWIATFLEAYGASIDSVDEAFKLVGELRAESCVITALELERLRTRTVLFFLDSVGQYIDHQEELRGLPLDHDLAAIGEAFGLSKQDALTSVRLALTGERTGAPLELLFPLLGHDRMLIRIGAVNSRLLHGRGLEPLAYGPDGKPFEPIQGQKPE